VARAWPYIKEHRVARVLAATASFLVVVGGVSAGITVLVGTSQTAIEVFAAGGRGSGFNASQLGGFGPARVPYDYSVVPHACSKTFDHHNRCGSIGRPVFDSFINTPSYGDERAFADGRLTTDRKNQNRDPINNAAPGDKLMLRTYVANDANNENGPSGCEAVRPGVAKESRVSLVASPAIALQTTVLATISAANAQSVYDHVTVRGQAPFVLTYVPGTAKLLRGKSLVSLSDTIATPGGALIGWHRLDGTLPGCFAAAALVEAEFSVIAP
jgi:hypothetical protein